MTRKDRLSELMKVPAFAAMDARLFTDEKGEHQLIKQLPRKEKRKLAAEAKKLVERYYRLMVYLHGSGVKFPVDQLIRQLAIEYNHRYASSGLMTQPISFNYFESFCSIRLFDGSVAPYVEILPEIDHLFSVTDFFDFLTSNYASELSLESLYELQESQIYNFTQNGAIDDFAYMTAEGREFFVSGFSMVRHGNSLHWFVLGGELMTREEWEELRQNEITVDLEHVSPYKRRFMSEFIKDDSKLGAPLPLDGTELAIKTIIAGETDLISKKHLARSYMTEHENSFMVVSDDPDIFFSIEDKDEIINQMKSRIEAASAMWNLAEGFFHLHSYFKFRLAFAESKQGEAKPRKPRSPVSRAGVGAQFQYVKSLEPTEAAPFIMRSYTAPQLPIETDGYWRRLARGEWGRDRFGKLIKGRTWITSKNDWRERGDVQTTVYIKSTIQSAKIQIEEYLSAAKQIEALGTAKQPNNVLYVLRCIFMKDEIYKVGYTSGTAQDRAKELSAATGVPSSFIVVSEWHHPRADELEAGVHALLAPYRVNSAREFFQIEYPKLKNIIDKEYGRANLHQTTIDFGSS